MTNFDPLDIRDQERVAADDKRRAQEHRNLAAEDLKWVLSSKQGRRFMWGLLEQTGVYRSSFTGNSETFFREGQRNVGLGLLALIHEHCPKRYSEMVEEQSEYERQRHANDRRHN